MDDSAIEYQLTDEERETFERDGFLVIENALPAEVVTQLIALTDALGKSRAHEVEADGRLHLRDFLRTAPLYMDLLDWPRTFPKVFGILGWHIQLYLAHVDITPPLAPADRTNARLGWHQDSGRLNVEMETDPRPRVSIKVGYFLTDTSSPGCGNFWVLPGSHLNNKLELPGDGLSNPEDAIPVCVKPGTAVIFDRRLWHSRSPNHSDTTRKAIFYGYSYRWLRPRDNLRIEDYPECDDAIRRQLLGASHDGHGYSSPADEDVPLRDWMQAHDI
jgi:ectoine hydroxylase